MADLLPLGVVTFDALPAVGAEVAASSAAAVVELSDLAVFELLSDLDALPAVVEVAADSSAVVTLSVFDDFVFFLCRPSTTVGTIDVAAMTMMSVVDNFIVLTMQMQRRIDVR